MNRKDSVHMIIRSSLKPILVALVTASMSPALFGFGDIGSTNAVSGFVIGSYYGNAKVCIDANNNAVCDADEVSTRTDANGAFTFPATPDGPIVAEIGIDAIKLDPDTGTAKAVNAPVVFRAPAGNGSVISALSTLVASEVDGGATLTQALSKVAAGIGVDSAKVLTDFNKEGDSLIKSQLLAYANNTTELIKAVKQNSGDNIKSALNDTLSSKNIDPDVLYVWAQFGAEDTTPFSKVQITGSSSNVALNANPVKGKVAQSTTYTVTDASGGAPLSKGALYARAITRATTCPQVVVDGKAPFTMNVRAPAAKGVDTNGQYSTGNKALPVPADFNVLTCEALIPDGTRTAIVNGTALKVIGSTTMVNRVVVIGDTGCRIKGPTAVGSSVKAGDPLQDCSDDRAWPYKRIAAAAASFNPDLILHNGDLHYREGTPAGVETPPGVAGTATNEDFLQAKGLTGTVTYGWAAWEEDFFKPSGPLLAPHRGQLPVEITNHASVPARDGFIFSIRARSRRPMIPPGNRSIRRPTIRPSAAITLTLSS